MKVPFVISYYAMLVEGALHSLFEVNRALSLVNGSLSSSFKAISCKSAINVFLQPKMGLDSPIESSFGSQLRTKFRLCVEKEPNSDEKDKQTERHNQKNVEHS